MDSIQILTQHWNLQNLFNTQIKKINNQDTQSSKSVELDFEEIEKFSIEWQKLSRQKKETQKTTGGISAEKTESKQENDFVRKKMAENSISKITADICANIPLARVDLTLETINESSADLVIFDPASDYKNYTLLPSEAIDSSQNISDNDDDNIAPFTVTSYRDVKTLGERSGINGFKISYNELDNSASVEKKFNALYNRLGTMLEEKIKLQHAHNIFTIHLPILNPFDKEKLTPREEAMNLKVFVERTNQWVTNYPNLRIQVQVSSDTKMKEVEEAYRLVRHEAHKNKTIG
jgi:hypothetical protein